MQYAANSVHNSERLLFKENQRFQHLEGECEVDFISLLLQHNKILNCAKPLNNNYIMTITSLPTDSLYKFLFLSGIVIIMFASFTFIKEYQKANDQLEQLKLELELFQIDSEALDKKITTAELETDRLSAKVPKRGEVPRDEFENYLGLLKKIEKDKDYREYLKFKFDYLGHLLPLNEDLKLLATENEKLITLLNEHKKRLVQIRLKGEIMTRIRNNLFLLYVFLCVSWVIGFYM